MVSSSIYAGTIRFFLRMLLGLMLAGLWGCSFTPEKGYPGPDQPKANLALIRQTDFPESRPIFVSPPCDDGFKAFRVDELGIAVLPGSYALSARLYSYEYRESARIESVSIYQGEAGFPIARPVLRKVLAEKPYKEINDIPLTVKAGTKYGVWCDGEKIRMSVLGPYH